MTIVYKLMGRAAWEAKGDDVVPRAQVDDDDGYMHLSTGAQVRETAARYFAGRTDVMLIAIDAERLDDLRWEASRGGALFPHAYGEVPVSAVVSVDALPGVAPEDFPAHVLD